MRSDNCLAQRLAAGTTACAAENARFVPGFLISFCCYKNPALHQPNIWDISKRSPNSSELSELLAARIAIARSITLWKTKH